MSSALPRWPCTWAGAGAGWRGGGNSSACWISEGLIGTSNFLSLLSACVLFNPRSHTPELGQDRLPPQIVPGVVGAAALTGLLSSGTPYGVLPSLSLVPLFYEMRVIRRTRQACQERCTTSGQHVAWQLCAKDVERRCPGTVAPPLSPTSLHTPVSSRGTRVTRDHCGTAGICYRGSAPKN